MTHAPRFPTRERAIELFHYEPETGNFFWRIAKAQRVRAGDLAGSLDSSQGYRKLCIDGKLYRAHRIAWLIVMGALPAGQIDHINGDRSDNRIANLREATNAENCRNARLRRDNSSGLKGVSYHKPSGKWRSRIGSDGCVYLGYFDCPAAAHFAYIVGAGKAYGKFARAA